MRNLNFKFIVGMTLVFGCSTAAFSNANAQTSNKEIIAKGEKIFVNQCEFCHGRGIEQGGTHRLRQRYGGTVTEYVQDRTDMEPEYIRNIVRNWNIGMPAIRPTEITDEELEWLIAYLTRNNL